MESERTQSTKRTAESAELAAAREVARTLDPTLTEEAALALLKQRDLSAETLDFLRKNERAMKSRKVRLALASHPHCPRRISLRLIREFYTFDLMRFTLSPGVAADLKRTADELLISRLPSISLGERTSLARRASASVAAALLLDREARVWKPALENPRLTEAFVVRALLRPNISAELVRAVCHHDKWSVRPEIRVALLRNQKTPLARALEFARALAPRQLRDVLHSSQLPEKMKSYLRQELQSRSQ